MSCRPSATSRNTRVIVSESGVNEQFDTTTGFEKSVHALTWSCGAILIGSAARATAL